MSYCDRCGILVSDGRYCTTKDRSVLNDNSTGCALVMVKNKDGKIACYCTSFAARQFKHQNKLSKEELLNIQKNCPDCMGTGLVIGE